MKLYNVADKLETLQYGDIIRGVYTQAKYTHDTTETMFDYTVGKDHWKYKRTRYTKQFLMYNKVKRKWIAQPVYIEGIKAVINAINFRDLKLLKEKL